MNKEPDMKMVHVRFGVGSRGTRSVGAAALMAVLLTSSAAGQGRAPQQLVANAGAPPSAPTRAVTFARDVAPILQNHCQVCHSLGSIGPMPLTTFEEVRPFAALISQRVQTRTMPPWHMDKTVGIQAFKNDISLSDAEIRTLVEWAESGTPMGDPAELPPPVKWPTGNEFRTADKLGAPDLVLRSEPYTVPAHGQDAWWRPTTETGITEPRWVRAVEVKPSYPQGRRVTHHTLVTLLQEEQGITGLASSVAGEVNSAGLLTEWAIGKVGEIYPEGTGKLLLPGSRIRWEVHYWPAGQEVVNDQVELAIWFYPKGEEPKYRTILNLFNVAPSARLEIPPRSVAIHQNTVVLRGPARIESFQPHMHMRGKAMSMEAIYPDGRRELLNMVSNFQWKWHINYLYETDSAPLLPEGTVLLFTSWHDNTAANPSNPDPDQYLTWGDRTVDEMAHAWVSVTYLEQEDFDRMVAERAERARARRAAPIEEEHIHP
jgi:hypothetical protein